MLMPGVEASESELRERLAEILCARPPLMRDYESPVSS